MFFHRALFCFIFLALISSPSFAQVTVAAASSLADVLHQIQIEFNQSSPVKLEYVFGSSGKLTAQILNGAPFDVFLSADDQYPAQIFQNGLALNEPQSFAFGKLVLALSMPLDASQGLNVLSDSKIKKIAVANPDLAPYGRAAASVLKKINFYQEIEPKLIFAESVASVNSLLVTKSVEAGFTSQSFVEAASRHPQNQWVMVPDDLYDPIPHTGLILKNSRGNLKEAKAFWDFLFSQKARDIFKEFGYEIKTP